MDRSFVRYTLVGLMLVFVLICTGAGNVSDMPGCDTGVVYDSKALELPALPYLADDGQLVVHEAYVSYYSNNWLEPYWVAYKLTAAEAASENVERTGGFYPERQLRSAPESWESYRKYGFDKGHMMPCMDAKWSECAMNSSFSYANCCPQATNLNTGVWKRVETKVNTMARKYGAMYVCAGPIVPANARVIGDVSCIAVPSHCFKALCYSRNGEWHATAFLFPNDVCKGSMFDYTLTVDSLESITGYDFFHNLPDDIERRIESEPFREKYWQ